MSAQPRSVPFVERVCGLQDALAAARNARNAAVALHVAASSCVDASVARWYHLHQLSESVLVVDDHAAVALGIAQELRALGVVIHVVGDYAAAVDLWRRERPAVVVVDVHLGDPNGRTGLDLLGRFERARAVLVSGVLDEAGLADAARHANAACFAKPIPGDRLREVVAGLLGDVFPDRRR